MRAMLMICALILPMTANAAGVTVFAASSLKEALTDVAALWTLEGHPAPQLTFGATATLARQIEQGADAQIFASADRKWMDYVAEKDRIVPASRKDLLSNEIVLVVPAGKPRQATLERGFDLMGFLGADGRLATGDPATVSVGGYAEQSLRSIGVWDAAASRLAKGDDARAGAAMVEQGTASAGIVYQSDAMQSRGVMIAGTFPASTHEPIAYPFAMTKSGDNADTRAFLAYLDGDKARAVFTRLGFKVK